MVTVLPQLLQNSRTVGNRDLSVRIEYNIRKKISVFRHEITSRFRYFIADSDLDEKFVIFIMRIYLNIFYLNVKFTE